MTSPTVSVVVVNWNSKDDLAACLASLASQTERDFETIVVDNGSTDGSLALLAAEFPWARVLATGENLGFAEGANRGIEASTGEWVATLNNDAEAEPRFVEALRAAAREADAKVGMLQAKILFRQKPGRTNSTGVLVDRFAWAIDRGYDAEDRAAADAEPIFCASAGAALYRRAMLDEMRLATGYFDRTFFMYFEDVDLGWRCRLAGWSALYVPSAVVRHAFQGSSSRRGNHFVAFHATRNRVRMALKNGSPALVVRALPAIASDAFWTLRNGGLPAIAKLATAARDGLAQRAEVAARARAERRAVEREWLVRSAR